MSVATDMLASISTPDEVESRLGTLEFNDGAPSDATAALLYDHLDFLHGVEAFLGALPGASLAAVRRGYLSIGAEDNSFVFFPELMDSASVFLTANCDTVYFWGFLDLTDGPMVIDVPSIEAPSGILGTVDDMWFRWVTDLGLPGPDRGQGGRYLMVGPGYDGPLPDSGFHVSHARTTRVTVIGRAFMIDNDPKVAVETIRTGFRVSPYVRGTQGTAVAKFLAGEAPLGAVAPAPETHFVEATGKSFNTVLPNDFGFWELVNELVQEEPPGAGDPDLLGLLAAVGIVHGKPFEPDARMRKILEEAVVVGNATARTVTFAARPEEGFAFYPNSAWESALFVGGYEFLDPPPEITAEGAVAAPSDGARKLGPAPTSSTWPPVSRRRCACGSPASGRSTSTRCATAKGSTSTAPATIASRSRPRFPRAGSGRCCSTTVRPAPCSGRISTCRVSAASPAPSRRTPTARSTCTSGPQLPVGRSPTGSRPFPARAGGRFFGSTTPSSRSSTRPGAQAKSSP